MNTGKLPWQKAAAYWRLAENGEPRGKDPRPNLDRSVEMAGQALRADPTGHAAYFNLGSSWLLRAHKWDRRHGIDPRPSLLRAIESLEKAFLLHPSSKALVNLCSAHALIGDYERAHGVDPPLAWQRAIDTCGRASALGSALTPIPTTRSARSWWAAPSGSSAGASIPSRPSRPASWRCGRRSSCSPPTPSRTTTSAPSCRRGRSGSGLRGSTAAARLVSNGQPAAAVLEHGLAAAERALGLNPAKAEALAVKGALLRLQSRTAPSRASQAAEPQAALDRARQMNPLLARDYPP